MVIGDDYVFIHTPKTGGMSITRFLLNNTDGAITLVIPEQAIAHAETTLMFPDIRERLGFAVGKRHETIPEAIARFGDALRGKRIFTFVRHPVDLMTSYYFHMRKKSVMKLRGMEPGNARGDLKLAQESDIEEFCRTARFYGMKDDRLSSYFRSADSNFPVDCIPLPQAGAYLEQRFGCHRNFGREPLNARNVSSERSKLTGLSEDARNAIIAKYPLTHEIYQDSLQRYAGAL